MRAILVKKPGDPDQLYLGDYPTPEPAAHEIRIRVRATALNRADLLQRRGLYPPPPGASPILGLDVAGEVDKVGAGVTTWQPGDRVCALLPGGGYAEYAVLHEAMAMPIPAGLEFNDAAAIPEVFLTAFQALVWLGDLQAGEVVLIHAGASGVGTAAIQLARLLGARPFVTASKAEKLAACRELGAELAINYRQEEFAERVLAATGDRGADLIIDFIGAPYLDANVRSAAVDGRIVFLAMMGGRHLESFDLRVLMQKRLRLEGSTLRSRSDDYKLRLTRAFAEQALPRFETGELRPVVDRVFAWSEAAAAHRYMEENRNIGKIILAVA